MTPPTTPNAPTAAEFPAISPQAEIEALRSMNTRQVEIIGELEAELSNVSAAIGTVEFMDLPDGGDVSLSEQVRRMRAALLAARREVRALRDAAKDCADELEAEVRNRYGYPDVHPAMQWRYERDMESVQSVRDAIRPNEGRI